MTSHEVAPPTRSQERVVAEFRARGGKVGGYHASLQLLLLTTTGARTGQRRAVPLTYLPDGDQVQTTRQIPLVILARRQTATPVISSLPPKTPATRRGPFVRGRGRGLELVAEWPAGGLAAARRSDRDLVRPAARLISAPPWTWRIPRVCPASP